MSKDYVPPLYNDFQKSFKDTFCKKFSFDRKVVVTTSPLKELTIKSTGFLACGGDLDGEVKGTYKHPDFGSFEETLHTNGSTKGKLKIDKLVKNATFVVEAGNKKCADPTGALELQYKREFLSSSARFDVASSKDSYSSSADVTAAIGFEGLSVGAQVKYDLGEGSLTDYNAGVRYETDSLLAVVQTRNSCETIDTSYLHKVNPDLTVGGKFTYNLDGKRSFVFATDYHLDSTTQLTAAINNSGIVQARLTRTLSNPNLKFSLTSKFSATGSGCCAGKKCFGLALEFGDF